MIAPRLYRLALNVLPRGFRRRYGDDMATMFEDTWVAGSASLRKREFGVRLALGAEPMGLMSRVLGRSLRLALGGALLGVGGALLLGPVLAEPPVRRRGA